MTNFVDAEESFKNYLKGYDLEDGNIKLKIKHTYVVEDVFINGIKYQKMWSLVVNR